jgi:mRNA-degrading endonuclease RelE of RelBE toxin-antitoxin system
LHIKSLQWRSNEYRLRIWKWRFLYRMEGDSTINFYDADSRGDVYK